MLAVTLFKTRAAPFRSRTARKLAGLWWINGTNGMWLVVAVATLSSRAAASAAERVRMRESGKLAQRWTPCRLQDFIYCSLAAIVFYAGNKLGISGSGPELLDLFQGQFSSIVYM
jgi:hypothetical protein